MLNLYEMSYEELKEEVSKIKPRKFIKEEKHPYFNFTEKIYEGTDVGGVQDLVRQIERNEILTVQEKIKLEKEISSRITNSHRGHIAINRGALNILLLVEKGATSFKKKSKISSLEALRKHALVFNKTFKVKRVEKIDKVEGMLGSRENEIVTYKYVSAISLTEFGKYQANELASTGLEVAKKDVRYLKTLGFIN